MVVELKNHEYERIKTLSNPLKFHLGLNAMIDAKVPGRIWVDSINNPESALIWDIRYSYYLAGREDNEPFNMALKELFTEEIVPNALSRGIKQYFLICPEAWKTEILEKEIITEKSRLRTIPRCYYVLKTSQVVNWEQQVPPNFQMEFINDQFLKKKNLKNFDSLIIEIEDITGSMEEFLRRRNFGYCLVHKKTEIVSWCLSFLHGSNCEAWVQTVEKHQKKGFATFTTAAFVEYCQNHNIAIGWHSNLDNQGSIKLAEKIGFERTSKEYSWVFGDHQE